MAKDVKEGAFESQKAGVEKSSQSAYEDATGPGFCFLGYTITGFKRLVARLFLPFKLLTQHSCLSSSDRPSHKTAD